MKKVVIPTVVALGTVIGIFLLSPGSAPRPPDPVDHLREIARYLGVAGAPDRQADALATDILAALRDAQLPDGVKALDGEAEDRAMKLLTKKEQQTLRTAQDLLRRASGRRVLLLGN